LARITHVRSVIRGKLWNRIKGREHAPSGQFVRKAETAETFAEKHGVDERTIRRDGKLAAEVDADLCPPRCPRNDLIARAHKDAPSGWNRGRAAAERALRPFQESEKEVSK